MGIKLMKGKKMKINNRMMKKLFKIGRNKATRSMRIEKMKKCIWKMTIN
jgi:hypothetical protein